MNGKMIGKLKFLLIRIKKDGNMLKVLMMIYGKKVTKIVLLGEENGLNMQDLNNNMIVNITVFIQKRKIIYKYYFIINHLLFKSCIFNPFSPPYRTIFIIFIPNLIIKTISIFPTFFISISSNFNFPIIFPFIFFSR